MIEAVGYETNSDGSQTEVCRLGMRNGRVVLLSGSGRSVLEQPARDFRTGKMLTAEDGEQFLRALPFAYSGSRFRMALEGD